MVAARDDRGGRGILVAQLDGLRDQVRDPEDDENVHEDRNRNHADYGWQLDERLTLVGEEHDERDQERNDRGLPQARTKSALKPVHSLPLNCLVSSYPAGDQRGADVNEHRERNGGPGHLDARDANEDGSEWRIEDDHGERIDRGHHERMRHVPLGQVAPDENHRGTGRDAEQDQTSDVLADEWYLAQRREGGTLR